MLNEYPNNSTHYKLGHSFPSHQGFVVPFRLVKEEENMQTDNFLSETIFQADVRQLAEDQFCPLFMLTVDYLIVFDLKFY